LVYRDGKLIHRAEAGKIEVDDPLPVASASKWVAAALIMTVVDEGKLSLDEPIGRRLPAFKGEAGEITLRQLLSFTSGQGSIRSLADLRQPATISLAESARMIAEVPLENPPGTIFEYGSGALQIAGALAESATGKSWHQLFQERFAGPLKMPRSRWMHPASPRLEARLVTNPNLQGGLVTTAAEYGNFLGMIAAGGTFEGRRILSPEAISAMGSIQTRGVKMNYKPRGAGGEPIAYNLGNWCERFEASGRCTLMSSAGALGTYPWIDAETGLYGIFIMRHRFPQVAERLRLARRIVTETHRK
jgi:CubicO group peptidase (beta-lactamase class C family)